MNCIGSMLPIWPSPTTLIVLYHMDALAFIADISGFYGYFKGETVVIWPTMLLVPYQSIYHYGNFHKRRGFQSVAARFGPPATLQRDMKARVPPANYDRYALSVIKRRYSVEKLGVRLFGMLNMECNFDYLARHVVGTFTATPLIWRSRNSVFNRCQSPSFKRVMTAAVLDFSFQISLI